MILRPRCYASYLSIIFLIVITNVCFGQSNEFNNDLVKYTYKVNQSAPEVSSEKLYLQFDKPYYTLGDTIWFKGYLLKTTDLSPSAKSGVMYLDITNDSAKVVSRYRFNIKEGLCTGNVTCEKKLFKPGTFTLYAYTNWMRNFGVSSFFSKRIYITNPEQHSLLVSTQFMLGSANGKRTMTANATLKELSGLPYVLSPLTIHVVDGGKTIRSENLTTDIHGKLNVDFDIPDKPHDLSILADDPKANKKIVIPVPSSQYDQTDIQFMPEGGSLVAGFTSAIAFKAIGEDGRSVDVSGEVINQDQKQLTSFKSQHNGMGSFDLDVKGGDKYTALVRLPGGAIKAYPLPPVKSTGTVLQVKNKASSDSLEVNFASTDAKQSNNTYFLIGKARGVICYAAVINVGNPKFIIKKIPKSLFPTGITHLIITTPDFQPVNERLSFIDHHDNLQVAISSNKRSYKAKDSIALQIKVTDNAGKPVSGNFSLSVTDNAQVRVDSVSQVTIVDYILLTGDLSGYVEEPGYYLSDIGHHWQELDNLLLCQGWVNYTIQPVAEPQNFIFKPEPGLSVKGRVGTFLGKPIAGSQVFLLSKSPSFMLNTLTNEKGEFLFDHLPRTDTPLFTIKATDRNGKNANVKIDVDEVAPPVYIKPAKPAWKPWYMDSDSLLISYSKKADSMIQLRDVSYGGHLLKGVKVTATKIVKDSQNLNGPGNADEVLDEKDLEAERKNTWLTILKKRVPTFRTGTLLISGPSSKAYHDHVMLGFIAERQWDNVPAFIKEWYFIKNKPVKFIIDGISLYDIHQVSGVFYNDITDYLNSRSAEDIKGIEIIASGKYAMQYIRSEWAYDITPDDISFVEITTRSGHGPTIESTRAIYVYKPSPITWAKEFYKPKYPVNNTGKQTTDLRATIDWEPNINTDANGEATLSFYAADGNADYTVIMEGTDGNGRIGRKQWILSKGQMNKSK